MMEFIDWEEEGINENFVGELDGWKKFFCQGTGIEMEENKLNVIGRMVGLLVNFYLSARQIVPSDVFQFGRYPNKVTFSMISAKNSAKLNNEKNTEIQSGIKEVVDLIKSGDLETFQLVMVKFKDVSKPKRKVLEELGFSLNTTHDDTLMLSIGDFTYDVQFAKTSLDELIQSYFVLLCKFYGYISALQPLPKDTVVQGHITLHKEKAIEQPQLGRFQHEDVEFDYAGLEDEVLDEICLTRRRQHEKRLGAVSIFRHKRCNKKQVIAGAKDYLNDLVEEEKAQNPEKYEAEKDSDNRRSGTDSDSHDEAESRRTVEPMDTSLPETTEIPVEDAHINHVEREPMPQIETLPAGKKQKLDDLVNIKKLLSKEERKGVIFERKKRGRKAKK
ncbi:unnamed protein product [Bursaphelenchus okinawaensis]|uniref:HORMA domain-containing protein n=1 Tax=Bursaphelenchus okinawaensis TaxID=465554 RepID=A0A811KTN7_9BILA|nr:unnamed protein product [Bursaphelenchus okinawaensis]CAG9110260.1 unnamed protein product [Bursaphelenchus okinawaensis]